MRLPTRSERQELWQRPTAVDAQGHLLQSEPLTAKRLPSAEPTGALSHWDAADVLTPVVLSETERRFKFRGMPQAVGAARRALREWERYFQPDLFYDLSLCVSELVTSRVQHAGGGEIELSVRRDARLVRAEISDPRGDVVVTELPAASPADWGMFIIDHVADRWGVDRSARTVVWCEIDLASERPQPSASRSPIRTLRRRKP